MLFSNVQIICAFPVFISFLDATSISLELFIPNLFLFTSSAYIPYSVLLFIFAILLPFSIVPSIFPGLFFYPFCMFAISAVTSSPEDISTSSCVSMS